MNILHKIARGEGGRGRFVFAVSAWLLFASPGTLHPQGILTITPSRGVTTSAGAGTLGYAGDSGAATAATLASPSAVAYDGSGNLYIAEAQNHVVREVLASNATIVTIAGTGIEGFSGDNGAATSAQLDTPTGVAVDANGNLYIADSHNHRIRKVSGGVMTTIAGNGTPGFSGDSGPATAAQLSLPSAVALDSAGNLYIADTNNQRIRKLGGATITTVAGNGEELFAGDGGAAMSAVLDSPTGVAVDSTGNLYIADRHNQRVRMVTTGGAIATLAGSGPPAFSGGFSGDGGSAAAASLARPSGVAVDAAGNIYIADTGNQRIRQVSSGTVVTVAGSAQQGFGGDNGPATAAILNSPRAVTPDALGNLTIADKLNERIRFGTLPVLTFGNSGIGIASAGQTVTLSNTGSASLLVASVNFTGAFATGAGGTCGAPPITLGAGASCTETITYLPTAVGPTSGSVVFAGTGVVPQAILLMGTGVQSTPVVALTSNVAAPFAGQAVTFAVTVKPTGQGTPTGTVSFYDGTTLIGTAQPLVGGSTSIMTTLPAGVNNISAVYSGDANFAGSTSAGLVQNALGFSLVLGPTAGSQTVEPGQTAMYAFNLAPLGGSFPLPVTLSATGLPPGATVIFTPQVVTIGAAANFTMTVQTSATGAALPRKGLFGEQVDGGTIALALLLLPFSRRMRQRVRRARPGALCGVVLLGFAVIGGLMGCGTGSGFFGQRQQTFTINITGTATAPGGAMLQHSTNVTLTVQ